MGADSQPSFAPIAPPLWAQTFMVLAVVASASTWVYITPLYFVSGGNYSKTGGIAGAIEVVNGGGTPDYILAAIPFFLLLMLVELLLTLASRLQCAGGRYAADDAWSSLAAGVTQQMVVALVKVPLKINMIPYAWIYHNIAVPNGFHKYAPVDSWQVWVVTFVAVDWCYYWFHRSAHMLQFLWAGHGVHHQSEYYNLSTALRQSWWASISGGVFYLPMALMIHPLLYATLDGANIVYQFWVHTCMVRRLPEALEYVLMTPSHHRVHHDRRVHKNFGGFLILWDRIHGSFQDEYETVGLLQHQVAASASNGKLGQEEVMLFGSALPVQSWTEVVTQTQFWGPVSRALSRGGKGRAAIVGPGYYTTGTKRDIPPPSSSATRIRKKSELGVGGKAYVLASFLFVAVATGFIVMLFSSAPFALRAVGGGATLSALYCQGLLLDANGRTGLSAETLRCILSFALCVVLKGYGGSDMRAESRELDGGDTMSTLDDAGYMSHHYHDYHHVLSAPFMQLFLKFMAAAHAASLAALLLSPQSFLAAPPPTPTHDKTL